MNKTVEIMGPPQALFSYVDSDANRHTCAYRSFMVRGTDAVAIAKEVEESLNIIREESTVIFWRKYPDIYEEKDEYGEPTGTLACIFRLFAVPEMLELRS